MASKTEICNQALALLGEDLLTTDVEVDQTPRAVLCRLTYDTALDALLILNPWTFAIVRKELTQLNEPPNFDYEVAYALPNNPWCLRPLEISETDRWKVEGRRILADAVNLHLRYIARITDSGIYPGTFTAALAARIALDMSYAITGKPNVQRQMFELLRSRLHDARSYDAHQGTGEQRGPDIVISARWGTGYY